MGTLKGIIILTTTHMILDFEAQSRYHSIVIEPQQEARRPWVVSQGPL